VLTSNWRVVSMTSLLVAVLLPACRGTDSQPPDASKSSARSGSAVIAIDACTLVTKDEAEAILGAVIGAPSRYMDHAKSMCTYVTAEGDATVRVDYPRGPGAPLTRPDDAAEAERSTASPSFVSGSGYVLSVESPSPAMARALVTKAATRLP
jgi:hypothetical protein